MSRLTIGSLFSGVGGMDIGLERAGMTCKWQVEIDPFCQKVLAKHWPNIRRYEDVRECGKHNLEAVDLICGGFPCQPHSVAGRRGGAEDDRNLWPEFIRIVTELRPRYVLAENVPGIITTYLDQVLSDLENANYTWGAFNLPACAFDAPHRRERIFVVAYSNGTWELQQEGGKQKQRGWIGNSSENVADAKGNRLERDRTMWIEKLSARYGQGQLEGCRKDSAASTHWTIEPDVGRVATRVPTALDGTLRRFGYESCDNQEAFAEIDSFRGKILRDMWYEQCQIKQAPHSDEQNSSNDSMYKMSHLRAHERWNLGQRIEKEEGLRNMWNRICAQPLQETQDMQQELLERIRTQERNEKVVSSRADRLRALGNAVVPQVAEWIGQRIVEFDSMLQGG